MSDDQVLEMEPKSVGSDRITETISVPFSADMSRSQHAKVLRQVANILHALLANAMRYAAVGDGNNAGAGFQIHQQTYTAAANIDAAAAALEQSMKKVLTGDLPPPLGGRMGRA